MRTAEGKRKGGTRHQYGVDAAWRYESQSIIFGYKGRGVHMYRYGNSKLTTFGFYDIPETPICWSMALIPPSIPKHPLSFPLTAYVDGKYIKR